MVFLYRHPFHVPKVEIILFITKRGGENNSTLFLKTLDFSRKVSTFDMSTLIKQRMATYIKTFYNSLPINKRINFKAWFLNVKCFGVNIGWSLMMNETYFGPQYYGYSPFRISWDESDCIHSGIPLNA